MDTRKVQFQLRGRQSQTEQLYGGLFHGSEGRAASGDRLDWVLSTLGAVSNGFPSSLLVVASDSAEETLALLHELMERTSDVSARICLLRGTSEIPLENIEGRVDVITEDDWAARHVTFDKVWLPARLAHGISNQKSWESHEYY